MKKQIKLFTALFTLILLFTCSSTISAESTIIRDEPTTFPAGKTIDNIIIYGHDVKVSGHVKTSIIVVNGDLEITGKANIHGYILVLGGKIHQTKGANVPPEVIQLDFQNESLNGLLLGLITLTGFTLVKFGISIISIIILFLIGVFSKDRSFERAERLSMNPKRLLLIGGITTILSTFLLMLLSLSIFGIPVVILIMIPILVFWYTSFAAIATMIGENIALNSDKPQWIFLITGIFIVISILNFPVIGWLILYFSFWISNGHMIDTVMGKLSKKNNPV